jgi:hypothetical protein
MRAEDECPNDITPRTGRELPLCSAVARQNNPELLVKGSGFLS